MKSVLFVAAALCSAVVGVVFPSAWALPTLVVPLCIVLVGGRWRILVAVVGIPLIVVSFIRFALVYARPHFDAGDIEDGEKNALSRIREIYWAESEAHHNQLGGANGGYLSFPELLGSDRTRLGSRPALLKPELYRAVDAARGVYQSEGYLYVIYLPGKDGLPTVRAQDADPVASSRSFAAYAWPADSERGGHRMYYVDQFEQVCESLNRVGLYGPSRLPAPSAYALNASAGLSACGQDEPSDDWHAWAKHHKSTPWSEDTVHVKEPRAAR